MHHDYAVLVDEERDAVVADLRAGHDPLDGIREEQKHDGADHVFAVVCEHGLRIKTPAAPATAPTVMPVMNVRPPSRP